MKWLVQCDFDGTVTQRDVSFALLDAFTDGSWRGLLDQYRRGLIPVGVFNSRAFARLREARETLEGYVRRETEIRPGFPELVNYCRRSGIEFAIVSNGLDFYINLLLGQIGLSGIPVYAARTEFPPQGVAVKYIGPDGSEVQEAFKESYIKLFLSRGYRVIYIGDGFSDLPAARLAQLIFARDSLLTGCREANLACTPFTDFYEVLRGLDGWPVEASGPAPPA